ncbi:hypothetical protein LTS17_003966 [Exophiala oligosperma]
MAPHEVPKHSVSKTKQERIRDNQRRSRARRAEYLAELERRLKECHGICREADLQRLAFADLQAENTRLRTLLSSAGLDPDAAGSLSQSGVPCARGNITAVSNRNLKPKFQHTDMHQSSSVAQYKQEYERSPCPVPSSSLFDANQTTAFPEVCLPYDNYRNYPLALNDSSLAPTPPYLVNTSPSPSYEWLLGPDVVRSTTSSESGLGTDLFHDPCVLPLLPTTEGMISSSVTRGVRDQDEPELSEMDGMQARESRSFGRSMFSFADRQVNSQVLFHLLNEMNSKRDIRKNPLMQP